MTYDKTFHIGICKICFGGKWRETSLLMPSDVNLHRDIFKSHLPRDAIPFWRTFSETNVHVQHWTSPKYFRCSISHSRPGIYFVYIIIHSYYLILFFTKRQLNIFSIKQTLFCEGLILLLSIIWNLDNNTQAELFKKKFA